MAVVQPYFDPTTLLQGGSIFSAYLQGFVKERSAMNRQMMELALAQADPTELYDQLESINKQIESLREIKYGVSSGGSTSKIGATRAGAARDIMRASANQQSEIAKAMQLQGGQASISYDVAEKRISTAKASSDYDGLTDEKKVDKILSQADAKGGRLAMEAFATAVNVSDLNSKVKLKVLEKLQTQGYEPSTTKQAFEAENTAAMYGSTPLELAKQYREVERAIGGVSGGLSGLSSTDQSVIQTEIDLLEEERKKVMEDLEAARSGNADIFQSFSGNYGLDNPFINVKTAYVDQPGVFAIASAVQNSKQELRQEARDVKAAERQLQQDARDKKRTERQYDRQEARDRRGEPKVSPAPSSYYGEYGEALRSGIDRMTESKDDDDKFFTGLFRKEPPQETSMILPASQVFTTQLLEDFEDIQLTEGTRKYIDELEAQARKQLVGDGVKNPTINQVVEVMDQRRKNRIDEFELDDYDPETQEQIELLFVGDEETPMNMGTYVGDQ